ncbi:MAG: hypothetical protein ACP5CD_06450 [Thermovirgaceae bacterium]
MDEGRVPAFYVWTIIRKSFPLTTVVAVFLFLLPCTQVFATEFIADLYQEKAGSTSSGPVFVKGPLMRKEVLYAGLVTITIFDLALSRISAAWDTFSPMLAHSPVFMWWSNSWKSKLYRVVFAEWVPPGLFETSSLMIR